VPSYFFRRTKRGGTGKGKGKEEKTKRMPIARCIQRRIIWITGLGDAVFGYMSLQERHATHDDTPGIKEVLQQYLHGE
jgi:hypothetical protein